MFQTMMYNASGCHCTSEEELIDLYKSPYTGAVVTKSCTLESRVGNPHPRYYVQRHCCHPSDAQRCSSPSDVQRHCCHSSDGENGKLELSINSTGLANGGVDYYLNVAEKIHKARLSPGSELYKIHKPYIISVSGLSIEENLKILEKINDYTRKKEGIYAIELNLSCPNIAGKPQTGYSPDAVNLLLNTIFNDFKPNVPLGLKLPPYLDRIHVTDIARVIMCYPINFITCCNSLGNGLVFNEEGERAIKPNNGLGGIGGGPIMKAISLSNVYQFKEALKESEINIIGCGGIATGRDIYEYILSGATAVQVGTTLWEEGPECFKRLHNELNELAE